MAARKASGGPLDGGKDSPCASVFIGLGAKSCPSPADCGEAGGLGYGGTGEASAGRCGASIIGRMGDLRRESCKYMIFLCNGGVSQSIAICKR